MVRTLQPSDLQQKASAIIKEVRKAIIGKDEVIAKVLMAILAKGHILLEDAPGVGKTTLALSFCQSMTLNYKRIQFTPEVMPADVVGFSIYNKTTGKLEYKAGAAMCNLLLVDEINRGSSKTQSALLESMEEGNITLDGVTRKIPKPFTVLATQNPMGSAGTQLLPESQLDRFLIKLSMGYPKLEDEVNILKKKHNSEVPICGVASSEDVLAMQKEVEEVFVNEDLYVYIASLAAATRSHPMIRLGVSPRGAIALVRMSQASAWLSGRDYMIPSDVSNVFFDVFVHRCLAGSQARINNTTLYSVLDDLLKRVSKPVIVQARSRK
jgi:MoxR-like ATPase